jgi:hypothetical protein
MLRAGGGGVERCGCSDVRWWMASREVVWGGGTWWIGGMRGALEWMGEREGSVWVWEYGEDWGEHVALNARGRQYANCGSGPRLAWGGGRVGAAWWCRGDAGGPWDEQRELSTRAEDLFVDEAVSKGQMSDSEGLLVRRWPVQGRHGCAVRDAAVVWAGRGFVVFVLRETADGKVVLETVDLRYSSDGSRR